jgi:hypothetical protein
VAWRAVTEAQPAVTDEDRDGLDDAVEDQLAERYAPVIHHGERETDYPVSVEWLLQRTALRIHDRSGREADDRLVASPPLTQAALLGRSFVAGGSTIVSDGTRSRCKEATFYLADVADAARRGAHDDVRQWVTYVHSFPNTRGGVTLQYWRLYAYNTARLLLFRGGHGGDWEGIAVHLDSALRPATVAFLDHRGIGRTSTDLRWEGSHPLVWSEEGGHASLPDPAGMSSRRFTRQETWTSGRVTSAAGASLGSGGGLVNVGEKLHPRNGQVFVRYSGLWGTPHRLFITSGYWGPAFNETAAACPDGRAAYGYGVTCNAASRCPRIFHTAWCDGMDPARIDLARECVAASDAP